MKRRAYSILGVCTVSLIGASLGAWAAPTTVQVSIASDGTQAANPWVSVPVVSANGRYVAFISRANNLVPGDTNGADVVFVRDLQTGAVERVSVASDGTQATDAAETSGLGISADARYVVFACYAQNIAAAIPDSWPASMNYSRSDIYVRDRVAGTTARVSVGTDGKRSEQACHRPAISGDGRYVAFQSFASNLPSASLQSRPSIYVCDTVTGETRCVSPAPPVPQTGSGHPEGRPDPGILLM